jgi:16S rRNA (cytosine1402-N4)-methyltransferase
MIQTNKHIPVLLSEVLTAANTALLPSAVDLGVWDATLGGGGHAFALLEKLIALQPQAATLTLSDLDPNAFVYFKERVAQAQLTLPDAIKLDYQQGNFADLAAQARKQSCDFILADLGLSQNLLDDPNLGLSYRQEAPLDMRYVTGLGVTAADLLNGLGRKQLHTMLTNYADIKDNQLVELLISARPFKTTSDLDRVILKWLGADKDAYAQLSKQGQRTYPKEVAKRLAPIYQALRIAVNLEFANLETFLAAAFPLLKQTGALAIITFHSGEQRVVAKFAQTQGVKLKVLKPSQLEVKLNPRARSAQLNILSN